MDILIVSRCLPYPLHHGDRLIIHHVSEQLRARGHHVDMLALGADEPATTEAAGLVGSGTIELVPERARSSLDYVMRLARPFPDRAERCWNPAMWEAIRRRLAERRYALVHFFGGIQVYECRGAVRHLPRLIVPYESYGRSLETALATADGFADRARLRAALSMARRYERVIYRGFDRVVLLTEPDATYLRALAPGLPAVVIPNGVSAAWLARAMPRGPLGPRLVFVGNYAYPPNLDAARKLVTEILPRVRAQVPGSRVTLVGVDPRRDAAALASPDVEVTGWVPDVHPHLSRAACLVAPIQQGAGMRNKILEAMAAGVPVVTTPRGCEGLAVTAGDDVLLGRDAAEMAAAIVRLLRDEPLRRRVAARARELVLRLYTWERVGDLYEALYAEVLAEWRREPGRADLRRPEITDAVGG